MGDELVNLRYGIAVHVRDHLTDTVRASSSKPWRELQAQSRTKSMCGSDEACKSRLSLKNESLFARERCVMTACGAWCSVLFLSHHAHPDLQGALQRSSTLVS